MHSSAAPAEVGGAGVHRIELLLSLIREALVVHPGQAVRIASVGCDDGQEIATALERWPDIGPRLDFCVLGNAAGVDALSRRRLAAQARRHGAGLAFVPTDAGARGEAPALGRGLGSRHLIYCDGLSTGTRPHLGALLPSLHEALTPGGLLALVCPPANEETASELLGWGRSIAGNSIEVRETPFGLHCFLAIRR